MANKVYIVYFSPTGGTKKVLKAMTEGISLPTEEIDVTVKAPSDHTFTSDDIVIFGGPIYGGRIPNLATERMAGLKGDNTPCIVVGAYGNVNIGDALVELYDMATAQGFIVYGAAAPICRHTFGEIQVTRPDDKDLSEAKEFAKKALEGAPLAPDAIPGNRPIKDGGKGGNFRPLTKDSCIGCGLCKRNCPAGAIADDFKTLSDACISCFRCIRNCPVGAKNMDTEDYNGFAAMFSEKFKEPKENSFYF